MTVECDCKACVRVRTGRGRCRIPEHRRQIRSLQKAVEYFQTRHSYFWSRENAVRIENDLLRVRLYNALHILQQHGIPLPETLQGIINKPEQTAPRPWWKVW